MPECGCVEYGITIFFTLNIILIYWIYTVRLDVDQAMPIVHIKNGTLKGSFMTSRKGKEFEAFRGIPYAKPPIGELRFEPPQSFGSWIGVRWANTDPECCLQRSETGAEDTLIGSEDCLYLNVYRPKLLSNADHGFEKKFTVMIWIHGGAFVTGSSRSDLYGPQFLLDYSIILVTVNYRLGALGFLSTEDLVCPGNLGLKDQAQAIKWVNENIAAFNGDPKSITIFGESAGSVSVHHHMVSPHVRGLFHRAITVSGSVMCPWGLIRPQIAKNQSIILGKLLDCPTEESSTLIGCLKKKNAVDIIATSCPTQVFPNCSLRQFTPVIELDHPGAYINEEPAKSLKAGRVSDVPWMTGINSQEGAYVVARIYGSKDKKYTEILDKHFFELAPKSLFYQDTCLQELKHDVTKSIRKFYLGDKKIDESARWNLLDMYTDAEFYIGSQIAVEDHLATLGAPIYYYYFAYRGTSSYSTVYGDLDHDCGVAHSDILLYLFPAVKIEFPNALMSEEDNRVADLMTRLFVNFAESGNRTPNRTSEIDVSWKPVRTPSLQYLHIGNSTNVYMDRNLFPERVNFWRSIPYRSKIECEEAGDCKKRVNEYVKKKKITTNGKINERMKMDLPKYNHKWKKRC